MMTNYLIRLAKIPHQIIGPFHDTWLQVSMTQIKGYKYVRNSVSSLMQPITSIMYYFTDNDDTLLD